MKDWPCERVGRVLAEAITVDSPDCSGRRELTLAHKNRAHDANQQTRLLKRAFDNL